MLKMHFVVFVINESDTLFFYFFHQYDFVFILQLYLNRKYFPLIFLSRTQDLFFLALNSFINLS